MLSKIRHYVDTNTIRSLYFSIFSSHINYCCQVWGQGGNPHLNTILSIQRSARGVPSIKILGGQNFSNFIDIPTDHSDPPHQMIPYIIKKAHNS